MKSWGYRTSPGDTGPEDTGGPWKEITRRDRRDGIYDRSRVLGDRRDPTSGESQGRDRSPRGRVHGG